MPESQNLLQVVIRSREKPIFNGTAKSLTSNNEIGTFDVLPQHANFISMVRGEVQIRGEGEPQKFEFEQGVMSVEHNKVELYITV